MARARSKYHHGDLRRELVQAGVEAMSAGGTNSLTLRDVARRAGVSHSAVYHHFDDKEALFSAVAEEGYRELARRMRTARTRAGDDPVDQIHAFSRAYVRFAADRPAHFKVMCEPQMHRGVPDKGDLRLAHDAALADLVASVMLAQSQNVIGAGDARVLAIGFWTLVHGYAESHRTGRGIFVDRTGVRLTGSVLDSTLAPLVDRMLRGTVLG